MKIKSLFFHSCLEELQKKCSNSDIILSKKILFGSSDLNNLIKNIIKSKILNQEESFYTKLYWMIFVNSIQDANSDKSKFESLFKKDSIELNYSNQKIEFFDFLSDYNNHHQLSLQVNRNSVTFFIWSHRYKKIDTDKNFFLLDDYLHKCNSKLRINMVDTVGKNSGNKLIVLDCLGFNQCYVCKRFFDNDVLFIESDMSGCIVCPTCKFV